MYQQQSSGAMSLDVKNIAAANTNFGIDLFKRLSSEKKNENIFFSPFSISVALAMTQLGARENTASEMAAALRWNVSDESVIHTEFQRYITLLQTPTDKYQLSTANRIYVQESYPILQDFLKSTKDLYNAEAVGAQFQTNADGERVKINKWVEEQTMAKIKDLLAPGTVDTLTRMILVNAIYFKGKWDSQFEATNTMPLPFKLAPSQTKAVPMMMKTEKYAYMSSDQLQCTVLEIPYKGKELGMVIFLPNEDFGLERLISDLTEEKLSSVLNSLGEPRGKVDLSFPKFEVTSSFSLPPSLSAMGMVEAFDMAKANFSGMTGDRDLHVSDVVHKAFVKVNEEGTEAAAATAVMMTRMCMPMPNPRIIVDHPFMFIIRDKRSSLLFVGAVADPSL